MNKTTAVLVSIIVVLASSFAWYAARHPDRRDESGMSADSGDGRRAEPRVLDLDAPTAGLDRLGLDVGVGEVRITGSADDQLHVKVTLKPKEHELFGMLHWNEASREQIAGAVIKQQRQDKRLTLSLDYPHDQDNLKQEWEVQVPARLALDADMKVGEMTIADVAGGVDAKLDVGELSIDTPKGRIHGDVNVGEIRATSGSEKHGRIELSSSIGETVVSIGGHSVGRHEHGGLGNHVSIDGDGPDEMRLSINIGEASLHITPADAKDGDGK